MKDNNSEVLYRLETQLEALNKKLDILIKQSSHKPLERSADMDRGDDHKTGKMQYKAVCAECGKTCGVPFKPAGERPVFCSECFARRQDSGGDEPRFQKRSRDFKKPAPGKKPFFKKR